MNCPKCGTNVDDRASFCPVCGTPLTHQTQQTQQPLNPQPFYRAPINQRSIAVAIVLSIVTCGIYMLYWLYCVANDLNIASGEENDASGGMVVLLSIVTCNIYLLYWYYKAAGKVNNIRRANGELVDTSLPILYLILGLFGFSIVSIALIQNELNKVAVQ